jgi:hypothetical protein
MKARLILSLLTIVTILLSGCMVGPKYVKPTVTMAPAFKEQPPESFKESDGWKPAQLDDQGLRGKWWEIFGDSQLNTLEEELTISNQDLKVPILLREVCSESHPPVVGFEHAIPRCGPVQPNAVRP